MSNSEKILKAISNLIETGVLTSKDIRKEISFTDPELSKNFNEISSSLVKELIINTNGQNTSVKRRSSVAQLRRNSQGSSLPSSGFNVDKEP